MHKDYSSILAQGSSSSFVKALGAVADEDGMRNPWDHSGTKALTRCIFESWIDNKRPFDFEECYSRKGLSHLAGHGSKEIIIQLKQVIRSFKKRELKAALSLCAYLTTLLKKDGLPPSLALLDLPLERQNTRPKIKRIATAVIMICVAVLLVGLSVWGVAPELLEQVAMDQPASVGAAPEVIPRNMKEVSEKPANLTAPISLWDGIIYGDPTASSVVEVWTSPLCPHCNKFEETLRQLAKLMPPDRLKIIHRHYPGNTELGASLALFLEAIADQDPAVALKFREWSYEHREELLEKGLHGAHLKWLQAAGIDKDRLSKVLGDSRTTQRIVSDIKRADALGFEGVPTIVVNGKTIFKRPQPVKVLAKAVLGQKGENHAE